MQGIEYCTVIVMMTRASRCSARLSGSKVMTRASRGSAWLSGSKGGG